MTKNKKSQTEPPVSGNDPTKRPKPKPRNPWTDKFIQVTEYLLKDYMDKVTIDSEFELFKKSMRIDAVIIKQEDGLVIDNAVMRSFKRHNIIEFKSPKDVPTIEAFDKTLCYYHAYLSKMRLSRNLKDVAIAIVSVKKPENVLEILREERNYKILNTETPGIYYIYKKGSIPEKIQLVISSELPVGGKDKSLLWLRSLRDDLTPKETVKLVKIAEEKSDDDPIRSIVYFLLDANPHTEEEVMKMVKVSPRTKKFLREFAVESGMYQEAEEEKAKDIARSMIAKNKFLAEEIAEYTGLDTADVVMLQSAML